MTNTNPSILLLGAGYVLKALASKLAPGSFLMSSRNPPPEGDSGRSCYIDLANIHTLEGVLHNNPQIHTVIDSVPPIGGAEGGGVNTPELVNVFEQAGIKRVIFLSSTGVYGDRSGSGGGSESEQWVTEESELIPSSETGKKRQLAEEAYARANFKTISLRLSGIYGPGREVSKRILSPSFKLVENRYSNRIHLFDIVQTIEFILGRDDWDWDWDWPTVLNVTDSAPSLMSEVVSFYSALFSIPVPQSFSREESLKLGSARLASSLRVSNAKLKSYLGRELLVPSYREGAKLEFADWAARKQRDDRV